MSLLTEEDGKLSFSRGFVEGIIRGASEYSLGIVPSVIGCLRGGLHGLWALAVSPKEVSKEVVFAAYSLGVFLSSCSGEEFLVLLIPEIRECAENWTEWSDIIRGQKLGYIIGKYSLEIFIPIGGSAAVKKYTALKRANTLAILECCTNFNKKTVILAESSKRAALRNICITQVKNGRILPKN